VETIADRYVHVGDRLEEVKLAVAALNRAKSPVSDGLTAEFYQCYVDLLAPVLCRLFSVMQEERRCAESFLRGVITLANYRPNSLLKTDSKILAWCWGFGFVM
uniref:Uncharacterized protein n=1 Tax=Anabas testudineus TaxID=64144 RepID=A0A3Q1JM17_ANATE